MTNSTTPNHTVAYTPAEITEKVLSGGVTKTQMKPARRWPLAILAGFYIGLGGIFCTLFMSDSTLPFALQKFLGGIVFSLGLMLVLVAGAELYTGNAMIGASSADGRISWKATGINLVQIWLGNALGAFLLVFLLYFAHVADMGHMAKAMMGIAVAKLSPDWMTLMFKGILCNVLVCLGVWVGYAGKTVVDKCIAIVLPISAFVALGFEHCVANLYFLPMAYVLKLSGYAPAGVDLDVITLQNIALNLSAATIGNTIGGMGLALMYWLAFRKEK